MSAFRSSHPSQLRVYSIPLATEGFLILSAFDAEDDEIFSHLALILPGENLDNWTITPATSPVVGRIAYHLRYSPIWP